MFQMIVTGATIWPIDILLIGFEIVTWAIHTGIFKHFSDYVAIFCLLILVEMLILCRVFISAATSW